MERSGSPHGTVETPRDPIALLHGAVELDDLGVLRIHGADAERFLQGQLSNDVTRLARERSLLAGLHSPQGRAIALLRLVPAGEHGILALLPRDLVATVAQRLSRFILRAKVRIADESAAWRARGFVQPESPGGLAFELAGAPQRWIGIEPAAAGSIDRASGAAQARTAAPDATAVAPHVEPPPERTAWRLLDIAAGLPQIHPQTSELFVAQMLNLDALDAISFSKGCYTGQEVIARAHYRGRVKRRMQRWRTVAPAALTPGESARLPDGRTLRVVEAARLTDGRCEILAVAPLATGAEDEPHTADKALLEAEQLPLPYDLPS